MIDLPKCCFCGQRVSPICKGTDLIGYKCINQICPNPKKEWTLSEDKDNQNWNIRHIRHLETQVAQLQQQLTELIQKLEGML